MPTYTIENSSDCDCGCGGDRWEWIRLDFTLFMNGGADYPPRRYGRCVFYTIVGNQSLRLAFAIDTANTQRTLRDLLDGFEFDVYETDDAYADPPVPGTKAGSFRFDPTSARDPNSFQAFGALTLTLDGESYVTRTGTPVTVGVFGLAGIGYPPE